MQYEPRPDADTGLPRDPDAGTGDDRDALAPLGGIAISVLLSLTFWVIVVLIWEKI